MSNIINFKAVKACPSSKREHELAKNIELDNNSPISKFEDETCRYLLADQFYSRALNSLINADGRESHLELQQANILKDQAFNRLRWGLVYLEKDNWNLINAEKKIEEADLLLDISLDLTSRNISKGIMRDFNFSENQDLMTVHGSAISYRARMISAARAVQAIKGVDTNYPKSSYEKRMLTSTYEIAERFLMRGDNLYETTSNRIKWARQELINGHKINSAKLIGRAVVGIVKTEEFESNQLKRSIFTLGNSLFMMNRSQALKSIIQIP